MLNINGKAKVTNLQAGEKYISCDLYWSIKKENETFEQEFFKAVITKKETIDKLLNSSTFDRGSYIDITSSILRVETYNNKKYPKIVIFECDEWIPETKEEPAKKSWK